VCKELLGQFKNNGAEWQAKGEATEVNVYDFLSLGDGLAISYGIYDLVHNHGFVSVGIDHDTAEFAQELAEEEQLAITVAHYPPATSKWNKIEHRPFSFISINWRAKPLTSLEVVLELISHTTTKEGLTVMALKDSKTYATGTKVTDEELAALNLVREAFHGEWNYTIRPQASPSSVQLI